MQAILLWADNSPASNWIGYGWQLRLKMFRYTSTRLDSFNGEIWLVYMLSQAPMTMATRSLSTLTCNDCNSSGLLCKVPMCIWTLMHAISQNPPLILACWEDFIKPILHSSVDYPCRIIATVLLNWFQKEFYLHFTGLSNNAKKTTNTSKQHFLMNLTLISFRKKLNSGESQVQFRSACG